MFTGIVEDLGVSEWTDGGLKIWAAPWFRDCMPGSSVAVKGVCLTVTRLDLPPHPNTDDDPSVALHFDLSPETLARTALGELRDGYPVNLERSATLSTRLGGHLVQGHVDGVGVITGVHRAPPGKEMRIQLPKELARYVVEKGSIALDGVSLTVTDFSQSEFGVALVPFTLKKTTLGTTKVGDRVNLEVDVLAKYVEGLMRGTT
jgi:riboflavin synthase